MMADVRSREWSGGGRRSASTCSVVSQIAVTSLLVTLFVGVVGVSLAAGEAGETQDDKPIYSRDGGYFGVRGVYAINYFVKGQFSSGVSNGSGFGLHVGYRTHEFLAGEIDIEIMDSGYDFSGGKFSNIGLTLSAKAYPLTLLPSLGDWADRFQPYVKAGTGLQYFYTREETFSAIGVVGRFGGGCEFYLTKRLALTFDATYVLTSGKISGLNSWTLGVLGLQWRFS